jgi:hypothetical protein
MARRKKSDKESTATAVLEQPQAAELKAYDTAFLVERLNDKNPRWMADDQREALEASLSKFGCVEPIIFNVQTQRVVGGHQRILSSSATGIEQLPVREVALGDDEEIALNIFLNKVKGQLDYAKTAAYLQKLSPEAIAATGFSLTESNTLIQSFLVDTSASEEEIESASNNSNANLISQLRNLTEEESREEIDSETYVQFGQFSMKVPTAQYEAWVASLISVSEYGVSPFGLGQVVASRLGILDDVTDVNNKSAEEETALFIGNPDSDDSDDEFLGTLEEELEADEIFT